MTESCPIPGCGYASNMRQFDEEVCRPLILQTTRSCANADACRDMDGFDVDEELARLRRAMKEARRTSPEDSPELYRFVAEAFENVDEYLLRQGTPPSSWQRGVSEPVG